MKNSIISLIGIVILLGGVTTVFVILWLLKTLDFWFGISLISIPILIGGGMFMYGIIRENTKQSDEEVVN